MIQTPRLALRELTSADAAFVGELLNTPSFLRYIGDRGVRTVVDAAAFIEDRYRRSYREHGFGLYLVERRDTAEPIGLCGFVRREGLEHPDLGFALIPSAEGQSLAFEAASATLAWGYSQRRLSPILAVVQPDNARSASLLQRLGFVPNGDVTLPGGTEALHRWRWDASDGGNVGGA